MSYTLTINDPHRAAIFREVLGTSQVQVLAPIPIRAQLPGFEQPQHVYLLDLEALTGEQFAALVQYTAAEFDYDPLFVEKEILGDGHYPILAADTTLAVPTRYGPSVHMVIPGGGRGSG